MSKTPPWQTVPARASCSLFMCAATRPAPPVHLRIRCFSTFPFFDFSDGILYDIPIIWLRLSLSRPSPRSWISNVMFVERL